MIQSSGCPPWPPDHPRTLPRTGAPTPMPGTRAMYTHPAFTRRGVGRSILALCEAAARSEGFKRAELVATMAGEPLYRACGYVSVGDILDDRGGAAVPLRRMVKQL